MKNRRMPGGNELLDSQKILENQLGVVYGSKIGDLGCGGNGHFTFQAAELVGSTGLVYAVDILKMVLKNIEHQAKMMGFDNIKALRSNLENYGAAKINDSSLDFALLITILFQNKQPGKIIREAGRMLKKGGKLLVIDWKDGRFPFGPAQEMKVKASVVNDVALGAGFKKVEDIEVGKFHYGIVFEKI